MEHGCYISVFEPVGMLILSSYFLIAYVNTIYKILRRLDDFVTCSSRFNIQSEGSNLSFKHYWKIKFSIYVHQKLIYTNGEQCYA